MYGMGIGTLNVWIYVTDSSQYLIWSITGDEGNSWSNSQAPVFSKMPFRLVFEAVVGSSPLGDIAIDDINFNSYYSPCTFIPASTAPATLPPTTITPSDSNCTFDKRSLCRWVNLDVDDTDWRVERYSSNRYTGPPYDHTSGIGWFAYISPTYLRKNSTAIIRSPHILTSYRSVCFKFSYYMFGRNIYQLNVYKVIGTNRERIWSRSHDLGDLWRNGQVEIMVSGYIFNIDIEGITIGPYGDIAVDDVVVATGQCPSLGVCEFEDGMCKYSFESSIPPGFQWRRGNDGSPSLGDGPKVDHTTGTKLGTYIYIKTASPRKENDTSIIKSRSYGSTKGGVCYNFWYHLMGQDIGTLEIGVIDHYHNKIPKWSKSGDQGDIWRHGRFSVYSYSTHMIYIAGIVGKNGTGDIAIDDTWVTDDHCPNEGACDFEARSFCSWENVEERQSGGYRDADWELKSSRSRYYKFPKADHTRGTIFGVYAYLFEGYVLDYNFTAQLVSQKFSATNGKCLSFWTFLFGHEGKQGINVYMQSEKKDSLQSRVVPTLGAWYQSEIGLYSRRDFQIIIEGFILSRSYNSIVAIDDIDIKDGNCVGSCSSLPVTARVACGPSSVSVQTCVRSYGCCYSSTDSPACYYHPSSCQSIPVSQRVKCGFHRISRQACEQIGCCYDDSQGISSTVKCYNSPAKPTEFPSTLPPITTPAPSQYDCTFENGMCNFTMKNGRYQWKLMRSSDHTSGSESGHFMDIIGNDPQPQSSQLLTPTITFPNGGDTVCVRFWFNMDQSYGQVSFNVYYSIDEVLKNPIWSRFGNVPREWLYAQISVPRSQPFKIIFDVDYSRSKLFFSVDVDDVSFINGPCPPRGFCDFENSDLCGWSQDESDDFDWRVGSGIRKSVSETRPSTDHTWKTKYGSYLYMGGSDQKIGNNARVESFLNEPTDGSCVEFYYYMKGAGLGTLNVWIRRGAYIDKKPLWTLSGDQGGMWNRAFVTVIENSLQWKIIFEGVEGGNPNADIAIDDINFLPGACVPKGDCDFEAGLCGYENALNNSYNWKIATPADLKKINGAPKFDHTTGLPTGHLVLFWNELTFITRKSHLLSEKFQVSSNYIWCLQFAFYMLAEADEKLNVLIRFSDRDGNDVAYESVFTQTGSHDDKWVMAKRNITSGYDFQIVFEGVLPKDEKVETIVAIDDIKVSKGFCPGDPITTPSPCALHCKDNRCIPSDKVCDFFPDCAQGGDNTDMSDEEGCDQCDFETGYCRWTDDSAGHFRWNRTHGHPSDNSSGPSIDHTKGTAAGSYIFTDGLQGSPNAIAVLTSPVIKQAHYTCTLSFWYFMRGGKHVGPLKVYVLYGDRLTLLKRRSYHWEDKWHQTTVYINRRVRPFYIKFKVEWRRDGVGDVAIDDIKFENCSLPEPATFCSPDNFLCRVTHACVPKERICDFTDDCGDESDEEVCTSEFNSHRCDFEDNLCDWQILDRSSGTYFVRKTGAHNKYWGPYSDHTTGTVSGHYVACKYSSYTSDWKSLIRARIASGPIQMTYKQKCQIRFYYYYIGRAHKNFTENSKFSVKIKQCTGEDCNETYVWSTDNNTWHNWIRADVTLHSTKPFQVLFELQARLRASLLIDDVSFYGCLPYNGTLPTVHPPKKHCDSFQFYCSKDNICIPSAYHCDFIQDCSDSEDESGCGSCDFTKGMCGYTSPQFKLGFSRTQPVGGDQNPPIDHTSQSKTGYFAISQIATRGVTVPANTASLINKISGANQNCFLQFYYYFNHSTLSATISVYYNVLKSLTLILLKVLQPIDQWQSILLPVQIPFDDWYLNITTNQANVAIDDISFINCSFPRANGTCYADQFTCKDKSCISLDQECNFVPDCHDGSDEWSCPDGGCNFKHGLCDWKQDELHNFDWILNDGHALIGTYIPPIDHTTGTYRGKYLSANMSGVGTARILSPVVKSKSKSKGCRMRFFFNGYSKQSVTLAVGVRHLNNTAIPMALKWQAPDNAPNYWTPAFVDFRASKAFQIIIEASVVDYGTGGFVAIDDISFSPDCITDPHATLPVQPTDECNPDIQFSCGDGQCILLPKVCNFVFDCDNKLDEETCPDRCNLENDNTCGWKNDVLSDMNWGIRRGIKPPFDHTRGNKYGHYLYLKIDPDKEPSFPQANLISPKFNNGAYNCSFSFWFYMYHEKVKDYNDAILNVLFKRDNRYTSLLHTDITSGKTWKNAVVQLPHCPQQFNVIFQGIHNEYTKTNISIDDWRFDCAEKAPKICDPNAHFQCLLSKQCISVDTLCDMDRNCCDGTDEDDNSCYGYTRYDFESGFNGWEQPAGHELTFIIDSGTSTAQTGPRHDHTSQEAYGKYVYLDASDAKVGQTSAIVSKTIDATETSNCNITFWYSMYGKDIGSMSMSIGIRYGKPETTVWNAQGDQGNGWKKSTATLLSSQDFQIIFIATVGGDLSDIALDDIQFSPGCRLSDKILPGAPQPPPTNPCKPLFQCQANKECIPTNQLCDFENDCPDGEDEGTSICGHPQGFENGFGQWKNNLEEGDYEFKLLNEKLKLLTGPKTDARGDAQGFFAYLNVENKLRNTKAILTSPVLMNSYSNCVMNFSYYISGEDVGRLRVSLLPNDSYSYIYLFDVKGAQGDKWIHTGIHIGRRRHPFTLRFVAYPGGGDGGIGIDEISFTNCGLPPKCISSAGKFRCKNNLCIDESKVCNLVDDCGDLSDEDPITLCSNYGACTFEDDKACHLKHKNNTNSFYWLLNTGETPSANTGPTHDHTFQTDTGAYMYIEASDRQKGDIAQIYTSPIVVADVCHLIFYYFMSGNAEGQLNVYAVNMGTGAEILKFHLQGDQGADWKQALIDLSDMPGEFYVMFEGVVGDSYLGDTAVDDIIFSPGCVPITERYVYPTITPCRPDEFSCASNGNCRLKKAICDGKIDCKGGSDEYGCPGGGSGKGMQTGSKSRETVAYVVATLVLIIIVVVTMYIWRKRRRHADNYHIEYSAENFEVHPNHDRKQINACNGTKRDDSMVTEFIDPIHDPNDKFTDIPMQDPATVFSNLHTNTYSSSTKQDLKDEKSIVNPFYRDHSEQSECDDIIS